MKTFSRLLSHRLHSLITFSLFPSHLIYRYNCLHQEIYQVFPEFLFMWSSHASCHIWISSPNMANVNTWWRQNPNTAPHGVRNRCVPVGSLKQSKYGWWSVHLPVLRYTNLVEPGFLYFSWKILRWNRLRVASRGFGLYFLKRSVNRFLAL